ncbi:unnamed protein product, partial [Cuscuta campestris]
MLEPNQLVNTRMREGGSVTTHINVFNTIISRLLSVDIKFDDEVQALLLLSSLPDSWAGSVTAISGSAGNTTLTFEGIRDFILGEDIRRKNTEDTVESWIMDSGASFHAISSSRKMKNLRQGNFGTVSLANNQTLDITGVGDIDLKTNLGTIWTLKDVRVEFDTGAENQGAKLVPEPVSEQETGTIVDTVPELEVGGNDKSEVASDSGSSESEDEQSPSDHTDQW